MVALVEEASKVEEQIPKKVPAPIPTVNVWQVKKVSASSSTNTVNGKDIYFNFTLSCT